MGPNPFRVLAAALAVQLGHQEGVRRLSSVGSDPSGLLGSKRLQFKVESSPGGSLIGEPLIWLLLT